MATAQTQPNEFHDAGRDAGLVKSPDGRVVPAHTRLEQLEHDLATNIKYLREQRGLSQTGLAKKMEEIGLPWHQTTVSRIEALDRPLHVAEAIALAKILGVPLEVLIGPADRQRLVNELFEAHERVMGEVNAVYERALALFRAQAKLHDTLGRAKKAGVKTRLANGEGEELTAMAEKALKVMPERPINLARDAYNQAVAEHARQSKPAERRSGPQHRRDRSQRTQ